MLMVTIVRIAVEKVTSSYYWADQKRVNAVTAQGKTQKNNFTKLNVILKN